MKILKNFLICISLGLTMSQSMVYGGKNDKKFNVNIFQTERREIALTFDDAPSPRTIDFLKLLKKHEVLATFFVVGKNIKKHRDIALKIHESGHKLGNHSMNHINLKKHPDDRELIENEISPVQELIKNITGEYPKWYRAAGLGMNELSYEIMRKHNLVHCGRHIGDIGMKGSVHEKVEMIKSNIKTGSILLMHLSEQNLPLLELLIPEIKKMGYTFTFPRV
jgi:peptidoglycan/xylan/chitin deacetylase (PgdA/CDA1 family)